jgi:integrase
LRVLGMVRRTHRLSARSVATKKQRGLYADGGGLYLQISKFNDPKYNNSKSWVFRYTIDGRARTMGLGPVNTVSLEKARAKALDARNLILDGLDPLAVRKEKRLADRLAEAKILTFAECAEKYIEAQRASWKNEKHISQWQNTLETYAYPFIGDLPVQAIDTDLVERVLKPIWKTIPETARRLRGRIERVLDWAEVRKLRTGDNPARWKGHLKVLLPDLSKSVRHQPDLPVVELPAFMADLRKQEGIAAHALEFLILTAARTGEVIGARRGEFNMSAKVWTIPAERMKGRKEHRVPLSPPALEVIDGMNNRGDFVFPGARAGQPLSDMALLAVLKRMGRGDITVHGFRTTFRNWAGERTNYAREVAEAALAHALRDKVEAAYFRSDLFEKRRRLMAEWAKYCYTRQPAAKVVSMNRA